MNSRSRQSIIFTAGVSLALLVWQCLVLTKVWSPALIASPVEILFSVPKLFSPEAHLQDVAATVLRSIGAFICSVPIGVSIGFLGGLGWPFNREVGFTVDILRSIPATALIPLFMVFFDVGTPTALAAGIFSGSLSIALATSLALKTLNRERLIVVDLMRMRWLQRLRYHYLPEIAHGLFIGLRTAMSLCLVLVIVAEMLGGSRHGLGRIIYDGQYTDDKGILYAAILLTGILGWALNYVLLVIEEFIVHWKSYLG